jgi:hypothetical protein
VLAAADAADSACLLRVFRHMSVTLCLPVVRWYLRCFTALSS